jgi:glycosyltransferase involved in cell wall biosynthesis
MFTSNPPPTFTVCTVTYNRAHLLPRLYESLLSQTLQDFEWLVVDSGTDETRQLVESWAATAPFVIRYLWKPAHGQYSAMNVGVQEAIGRFFASLDSDDRYVPQALERLLNHWETIPADKRDQFVAVCGLDAYESGEIVGTRFPQDVLDSDDIEIRFNYRVKGDKVSIMRTDVMRQYPFPEECGTYISPAVVWNRIGLRYKTRFVNEVFAIIEYQNDGQTAQGRLHYVKHPESITICLRELINSGRRLPLDVAIKTHANYVRYSLHQGVGIYEQARAISSQLFFWLFAPLGILLRLRDLAELRDEKRKSRCNHALPPSCQSSNL